MKYIAAPLTFGYDQSVLFGSVPVLKLRGRPILCVAGIRKVEGLTIPARGRRYRLTVSSRPIRGSRRVFAIITRDPAREDYLRWSTNRDLVSEGAFYFLRDEISTVFSSVHTSKVRPYYIKLNQVRK